MGPSGHLAKFKISFRLSVKFQGQKFQKFSKSKNFQSRKFSSFNFRSMSTFQKMSDCQYNHNKEILRILLKLDILGTFLVSFV